MKTLAAVCEFPECNNWTERASSLFCATHNAMMRKAERQASKDAEKLAKKLLQQKARNQEPKAKPKKVSEKQRNLNKEYGKISEEFKRSNPTCAARINGYCTGKTESVHHKRGRGRYLLDVSTFLPCCLSCHTYIENHPEESKEKGWSQSRLAIDQTRPTI